ncbi:MAG: hypothetical protein JXR88_17980 [Clostridia bacterium]|nr:hypothetical protein [Clostridia bacterium]
MDNFYSNQDTIDEVINNQIKNSTSHLNLNDKEKDFLKKFALLVEDALTISSYGAALPYLHKSLISLISKNEDNALINPFIKIGMTMEDATFRSFIILFANLFNINSIKEDTFSIRTLFRSFSEYKNDLIVIDGTMPNILNNSFKLRELCKRVFRFFSEKSNIEIISNFVDMRNHGIGHSTIKAIDYTTIEKNLNHFFDFLIVIIEELYDILKIKVCIDIRKAYDEDRNRWGFYLSNINKYENKILSNEFTIELTKAYEIAKNKTKI